METTSMTNPNKDTKKTITELKKVAGGATSATIESASPPHYTPGYPVHTVDVANVSAGATAQSYGSVADGGEPQIPEVFPPPTAPRIQGQSPSMQQFQNVVAGATAPGASIGDSGPALPIKPQMSIGANATPVAIGDLDNAAAGATAPGSDIGDVGPATPTKPSFQIGPGNVPVQTENANVT
jgi:hypothetical protein